MNEIYEIILKLKQFCNCNENRISSFCHINLAELKGINTMEKDREITCSKLAEKMDLSPSRVSRITDNLTKKGYLLRQTKDNDRRSTFLCLTKKGEKIKDEISLEQKNFQELLEAELSVQEIESIKIELKKLEKILLKKTQKGAKNVRKNVNRS